MDFLQSQNLAQRCVHIDAQEATEEELQSVHEADYVQKIFTIYNKVKLHLCASIIKKRKMDVLVHKIELHSLPALISAKPMICLI